MQFIAESSKSEWCATTDWFTKEQTNRDPYIKCPIFLRILSWFICIIVHSDNIYLVGLLGICLVKF